MMNIVMNQLLLVILVFMLPGWAKMKRNAPQKVPGKISFKKIKVVCVLLLAPICLFFISIYLTFRNGTSNYLERAMPIDKKIFTQHGF